MNECKICSKDGKDLSLLSADHKDLGEIMICRECWIKLYQENRMVGGTSTGNSSPCSSCNICR